MSVHNDVKFTITKGGSNRGKGKNVPFTWGGFKGLLKKPLVSGETMQAYIEGSQDFRNEIKSSAGWYQACATEGGHRTSSTLYPRLIITVDVDEPTPELWKSVKERTHPILSKYEYFAHLTKSATSRKPKFRIIFLSSKPIPAEHFRNLCTLVSQELIDATLHAVDDVSFRPPQLMYLPVVSSNQEYEWVENEGEAVDPYYIATLWGLAQHGDTEAWTDFSLIPASERQGKRRETQAKAQRPKEKDNIVGAFCRVYSVEDAMAEFIPGIYEPTEGAWGKPRYTYTGGSGSGGVVVEDDGDFIFSHHQSDPCGESLCNAFDMVRLHLFKDEDHEADPDTKPQKLPSFEAMSKLALHKPEVRGELLASRVDADAMFDEADVAGGDLEEALPAGADVVDRAMADPETTAALAGLDDDSQDLLGWGEPKAPPKNWMRMLDVTESGAIKTTAPNLAIIIENDPRFWGRIGMNEMTGDKYLRKDIITKNKIIPAIRVADRLNGDQFSDRHMVALRMILESPSGKGLTGWGIKTTDRDLEAAVEIVAFKKAFHPVRDFLRKQTWDGHARLDDLFIRYLGLDDTPYHRAVSRLTIVAAITRVFEPGHKFDFAPVLEGLTGIGKSTFIKALGMGRWFAELTADLSDAKACVEQMKFGALFMELPELTNLTKADVNDVKAFLSRVEDVIRLAYDRYNTVWKRTCVFLGSTNNEKYLKDPTGNRRFWPIKVRVSTIDIVAMIHEMPQVYAEAYKEYVELREAHPLPATLPLYLTDPSAKADALAAQEAARVETAEEFLGGDIEIWANTPIQLAVLFPGDKESEDHAGYVLRTRICSRQVWIELMGKSVEDKIDQPTLQRIASSLKHVENFESYEPPGPTKKARFPGVQGQQAWFVRVGSTYDEIFRGWVPAPETEPDDGLI